MLTEVHLAAVEFFLHYDDCDDDDSSVSTSYFPVYYLAFDEWLVTFTCSTARRVH